MKLLYNEEEHFCTKTDLLNFKLTLPLAKLVMVGVRLVSNGLIFSDDAQMISSELFIYCYLMLVN